MKFIKAHLFAYYQGWKLRKIYNSRFVRNAISQYEDYRKFIAEMDLEPNANDQIKK